MFLKNGGKKIQMLPGKKKQKQKMVGKNLLPPDPVEMIPPKFAVP